MTSGCRTRRLFDILPIRPACRINKEARCSMTTCRTEHAPVEAESPCVLHERPCIRRQDGPESSLPGKISGSEQKTGLFAGITTCEMENVPRLPRFLLCAWAGRRAVIIPSLLV